MRAITVQQPWAYAIFYLGKDIENRDRRIRANLEFPLDVAIHVGKKFADSYKAPRGFARQMKSKDADRPEWPGKIIGVVTIDQIVEEHSSPWFSGYYGYVLKNPRLLKTPLEARGSQALHWEVPDDIRRKFRYQ